MDQRQRKFAKGVSILGFFVLGSFVVLVLGSLLIRANRSSYKVQWLLDCYGEHEQAAELRFVGKMGVFSGTVHSHLFHWRSPSIAMKERCGVWACVVFFRPGTNVQKYETGQPVRFYGRCLGSNVLRSAPNTVAFVDCILLE